jgi:two-component system, OmpR family, sensor kinase
VATTTAAAVTTTEDTTTPGRSRWRGLARSAHSIRTRIVAGYLVLAVAALGLSVVALRQLLEARVDRDTDSMMASDTAELANLASETDPDSGAPLGADVRTLFDQFLRTKVPASDQFYVTYLGGEHYLSSTGSPISRRDNPLALGEQSLSTQPWRGSLTIDGVEVEAATVPLNRDGANVGTFAVLRVPAAAHADVDRVVRTLGYVGVAVLLLGLCAAWLLAGRVLRPVRALTATARTVSDRELSTRIPVTGDDELSELGRRFNEMLDRIERGAVQQRQFVDDVAHELRTPITIIRGHLDVMGDDPAERAETIAIVDDELERMNRYVSDLLLLARAELPDFVQPDAVDVAELIAAVHNRVSAMADRRWVVDEAPDLDTVTVTADAGRMTQAMVNLATNAVEHTAAGAEIGIGGRALPQGVELWVRDTGPGVDPAIRDTLFDRAHRGPSSRARRPDGTGIGLSIVAAIAEAHGGSVRVDPAVPTGARFVITIRRPTRGSPMTSPTTRGVPA